MSEPTLIATGPSFEQMTMVGDAPEELPHGTRFTVVIHGHLWNSWWADLAGAEWIADQLYNDSGAILKKVSADGPDIVMEMEANAVWIWALFAALAIIVTIALTGIDIFAWLEGVVKKAVDLVKWGAIAAIAILGIYGLTKVTSGGKSSQGRSPPTTIIIR